MDRNENRNEKMRGAKDAAKERRAGQAELSFPRLAWVFAVGCLIGYIVEMLFCRVVHGYWQNKQGMVYGPFNQVYGFGAVLMTLVLAPQAKRGTWRVFGVAMLAGGAFEFTSSLLEEVVFGSQSWDFSDQMFHFGGRTSLLFMFFWGILGVFFIRLVYPWLCGWVDRIPRKASRVCAWVLVVFFAVNLFLSGTAVLRWQERLLGNDPKDRFERFLDAEFPNGRMEAVYPRMILLNVPGP